MSPRVSVITAVYNGEAYFSRAVPSILEQRYTDFEYVIIDDGSTDGTPAFLQEMARRDRRVRVLSPGRIGFANALNHGIERAEGEYIARQDFDDRSLPDRLSLQVGFLDSHSEVGLVGGYCFTVHDHSGERYVRKPPLSHQDILRAIPRYIPFAHTLVMFRKKAWKQAGGYPEVEDIEDLRLWIEFVRSGWRLANLPEVLGEHWVHPDSFWHRNFDYRRRQRTLSAVQWRAVRQLGLPLWMYMYPLGRWSYQLLPHSLRLAFRRLLVVDRSERRPAADRGRLDGDAAPGSDSVGKPRDQSRTHA